MDRDIYVSGLYSGPSPSAGLGVARALREAFPRARLVGVDYWAGSSGLHHAVFDRTWLKPPWTTIEKDLYAEEIRAELDRGALWIPTLDLEIAWLARAVGTHAGLLAPDEAALAATRKPSPPIAEMLPFDLPASLDLSESDEAVYAFCRRHSWRVWLKGPYHEAVFVSTWRALEGTRAWMRDRWRTDHLSVQAHVDGHEESIALAAVDGRVADATAMRKRIITPEGKTWAGRIGDVTPDVLAAVEAAARALHWTGGAEIELLRDPDGRLWLLEWNPRFPAWVYGAALAERNLPAALVRGAVGIAEAPRGRAAAAEFTRVVIEVPVRPGLPLPLPTEPEHGYGFDTGKYGASLRALMPTLMADAAPALRHGASPRVSTDTEQDLLAVPPEVATPHRAFLPRTAAAAFARLATEVAVDGVALRYAYSLKTSPDAEYLALARSVGMLAECISQFEVRRAIESGWPADMIVLNGPGKWWPDTMPPTDGLRAVFCDSIEEVERLAASGRTDRLWGVRLRVPEFPSRFGIPVDEPALFERLCVAIAALPQQRAFGIHLHLASTFIGVGHWQDAVESAIVWARTIESAAGRAVSALDFGGGYHPDDFAHIPFRDVMRFARQNLPSLSDVYVEPGRALTQTSMALITRVLDVRRSRGAADEIVVDACIADLPLIGVYPHRVFRMADGALRPIGRGSGRVLGRVCMEDDVLFVGLDLPDDIGIGDRLVVCDAGAYERSMSYAFGRAGYA